jgi:hypothetical protein
VQPFYLETSDNERLFCWHVLPLDVYLQNEEQLAMGTTTGEIVDELKGKSTRLYHVLVLVGRT